MRFFSNEAKDNDERDPEDRDGTVQSEPVAVPAQRAGSPWQHAPAEGADRPPVHEPAPQPTAFGASTVGGAVAASAAAGPQEAGPRPTDRTTDAASGVADDQTVPIGDARHADDVDRTVPLSSTTTDDKADHDKADHDKADRDEPGHDKPADETPVDVALEDHGTFDDPKVSERVPEKASEEAAVDLALEDRGTFDDPKLADETRPETKTEKDQHEKATPAGPPAFFPTADTEALRERWRDVQLRFVDDPKGATAEAAGLVDEAVDKLTSALRDQRGSLSKGSDDTEALRVELRSYRDILDRLLGL
ncbi:hypothetical protein [Actinoplanes aureus]|uniref:Uncharacterized protein n=1 Tax=Actinoplanes aureus TaxID=2792083 RepID=A0A931G2F1_9ACTN|nr:hypothetical protein [Actinoplanes aureus]MBG0567642.1 hypothetical protein [Actinoplanes aureus]